MTDPTPISDAPHVLRTFGLRRSFGKQVAVNDVALELRRGEVYGFLGRNGAGKTTTLKLLMGVLRADKGEFELLGERTRRVEPRHRLRLGYVSQEQNFYGWMTARELGTFVGRFYPTWDDAEFVQLSRRLDVPLERKASQLSGGTRSKLALALALSHRPELLLLDEPTAGLDPVARREFLDLLRGEVKARGQSVLFSSHLVSEVEQVSHAVGIIQEGSLRYQGTLTRLWEEVRELSGKPGPLPSLPEPFEMVRVEQNDAEGWRVVVRASVETWETLALPPEWEVVRMDLEEIFLAFARRSAA